MIVIFDGRNNSVAELDPLTESRLRKIAADADSLRDVDVPQCQGLVSTIVALLIALGEDDERAHEPVH